jgi:hypothetical protein
MFAVPVISAPGIATADSQADRARSILVTRSEHEDPGQGDDCGSGPSSFLGGCRSLGPLARRDERTRLAVALVIALPGLYVTPNDSEVSVGAAGVTSRGAVPSTGEKPRLHTGRRDG